MQFLYLVRPTRIGMLKDGPTAEEARVIGEHFGYLQDLLAKKVLLMVGRTQNNDERTFGIAVFEADDEAAARQLMESDPAVRERVMTAELFPYKVALWSTHGPRTQ